jgi:hypothetical protein
MTRVNHTYGQRQISYLPSLDDKCDTLGLSLVTFLGVIRFVSLRSSRLYR